MMYAVVGGPTVSARVHFLASQAGSSKGLDVKDQGLSDRSHGDQRTSLVSTVW